MGANPIAGAMIFAVLSALGIEWAGSRGRIREDSAIGIIWSVGMAVGALFMSLRPGYTSGDLSAYLFGSIVTVTDSDVAALAALTAVIIAGALLWLRPVMYTAFDRDFARSRGIPTRVISYLMAALVAVTIVLSIRIMGIVLLISLADDARGDRQLALAVVPHHRALPHPLVRRGGQCRRTCRQATISRFRPAPP